MKNVFKLCIGAAPDGMFFSIFPHAASCIYYLDKKTKPTIGLLYAFSTESAAMKWFNETVDSDQKADLLERLPNGVFNVYLLSGECTRIVSRYAPTFHHLPLSQLRQKPLLEEFWGNNVTTKSNMIVDMPEPSGSILISDFRPVAVVNTIHM